MVKKSTLNNMVLTTLQKVNNRIQVQLEGVRVDSESTSAVERSFRLDLNGHFILLAQNTQSFICLLVNTSLDADGVFTEESLSLATHPFRFGICSIV